MWSWMHQELALHGLNHSTVRCSQKVEPTHLSRMGLGSTSAPEQGLAGSMHGLPTAPYVSHMGARWRSGRDSKHPNQPNPRPEPARYCSVSAGRAVARQQYPCRGRPAWGTGRRGCGRRLALPAAPALPDPWPAMPSPTALSAAAGFCHTWAALSQVCLLIQSFGTPCRGQPRCITKAMLENHCVE